MIGLARKGVPFRPYLGQAPNQPLITVIDRQGKPVQGAHVTLRRGPEELGPVETDGNGDARFDAPAGMYDVIVRYNGHTIWKEATPTQIGRGETIVVEFPFCVRDPILKPVDIGLLLAAGALTAGGMYWKVEPLKVVGEVIFGATAFTVIYRLSCL
jgi:carboxypeptidase family protein